MSSIRTSLFAALSAAALAGAATAGAADGSGPTASAASGTTVQLEKTKSFGPILATKTDFTLYLFTHDTHGKNTCISIPMCSGIWPPYIAKGTVIAGAGVKKSLLGTVSIGHGQKQVTYAGHPLYTYKFDSPRSTGYVGANAFGGDWEAVSAAGKAIGH